MLFEFMWTEYLMFKKEHGKLHVNFIYTSLKSFQSTDFQLLYGFSGRCDLLCSCSCENIWITVNNTKRSVFLGFCPLLKLHFFCYDLTLRKGNSKCFCTLLNYNDEAAVLACTLSLTDAMA